MMLSKLVRYARSYTGWLLSSLRNGKYFSSRRPILLVTGADSSHYLSLAQFLESAARSESDAVVVAWDLGLTSDERSNLENRFPSVNFRDFPYSQHPSYFDIRIAAGEYAWKPVALKLAAQEFDEPDSQRLLVWCDSGNIIFRKLRWVRRYTAFHGIYSQFSTGNLGDWTHPDTLRHFGLAGDALKRRNANGAIVAFDLRNHAGETSLRLWSELAKNKSVIAPEGSDRGNHRQDQALLSCILVSLGLLPDSAFRTNWTSEYRTNCDVEKGKGLHQRWELSGRRITGI